MDKLYQNTQRWINGAFPQEHKEALVEQIAPEPIIVTPQKVEPEPFDKWYAERATKTGINPDHAAPGHFYNYKKAYEYKAEPDEEGHWPSAFKDDMHPNRFVTMADGLILDTKYDRLVQDQADIVGYFLDGKPVQQLIRGIETVESNGNPNAKSKAGAVGSMQIIPKHGLKPGYGVQPWNPKKEGDHYRFAKDYVAAMYNKFGNINDALIAYNWGPANLDKWIGEGRPQDKIPREAKEYPFKVLTTTENILSGELSPLTKQTKGVLNVREYP